MAQTNVKSKIRMDAGKTHEGARAMVEDPIAALRRVLNAHLLWEDTFYMDGKSNADVLTEAVARAVAHDPLETGRAIIAARKVHNIRHAPLLAAVTYAKLKGPDGPSGPSFLRSPWEQQPRKETEMGLDQYAWALKERPEKSVDFKLDVITDAGYPDWFREDDVFGNLFVTKDPETAVALACWRKHPDLHGLIHRIYNEKGGDDPSREDWGSFAGPVVLDKEDIDRIEEATKAGALPHTTGFFFGETERSYHDPLTLEFCRRAREYLAKGWTIVYNSSW
jgi:hypothetical protein